MDTYYQGLVAAMGTSEKPGPEARRFYWFLRRRRIKLNVEGFAPDTDARDEMIEAGRSGLEKLLQPNYGRAAVDDPDRRVFSLTDILEALPARSVAPMDQNLKAIERVVRALGCRPIKTSDGRRRQVRFNGDKFAPWTHSEELAARYAPKTESELRDLYRAGRAAAGAAVGSEFDAA